MVWDEEEVDLRVMRVKWSYIHMEVGMGDRSGWMLTAVYANPNPSMRKFLWEQLEELTQTGPWLLIGDLNCVLEDDERSSN